MKQTKDKLAIFDIDGTLTDSVKIHQAAFEMALTKFGFLDFNTNFSAYKHHTDSYIFKTIFEAQFKKPFLPKYIEQLECLLYEFIFEALSQNELKEIAGAKNFLTTLTQHSNFDIVFATGSLFKPAKLKLEQVGISIPDSLLIAANKLVSRDEIVLKAIETAKAFYARNTYTQIISFGDGLWDYETAKKIQVDFIGINNEKLKDYAVPLFYLNYTNPDLAKQLNITKATPTNPDFDIKANGEISEAFLSKGILRFRDAAKFIQNLPYGRNANKNYLVSVFTDLCGTCSTKHALLKQLAEENNYADLILFCGIFRMNSENTPEVSSTLKQHGLDYIPEAHMYLKYKDEILDFTKPEAQAIDFADDLMEEIEILPHQITEYKVNYHKKYLEKWLENNTPIKLSLDELWAIREQCIQDLAE